MDRTLKAVLSFTLAYLLVATWFAVSLRNWEFVFYIGVVVILGILVAVLHRRVPLSTGALWCLSLWGLLHMIGGLVHVPEGWPVQGDKSVFYSLWLIPDYLKYDQILHAFGFGASTWICWQVLRRTFPAARPTAGILLLCALAGMGLGAVNEIIEFMATILIPDTNVGGYLNTGWDLVANAAGAAGAAAIIRLAPARA